MANQEWENERLYVLETVKGLRDDVKNLDKAFTDFKTDVKTALATIQTKLTMYALIGSTLVTLALNYFLPK